MARITVEDCLENVDNLFELVLVASRRARRLANGAEATLPWENDKPTVMALREVAEGMVGREILEETQQMFDETPAPVAGEGEQGEVAPELTIPQTIPAD